MMEVSVSGTGHIDVRFSRFEVNAFPDPDHANGRSYTIYVDRRRGGAWLVRRPGEPAEILDCDGRWSFDQPQPGRHLFDLPTALRMARQAAPEIVVNSMTPAQCWQWTQQQQRKSGGGPVDG